MAVEGFIAVFLGSWLIGAAGIYLGVQLVTKGTSFRSAAITSLLGAAVWGLAVQLLGSTGWGPALALAAWILLISIRHETGVVGAALIGLLSWISTLVILHSLASLGIGTPPALGIPGL